MLSLSHHTAVREATAFGMLLLGCWGLRCRFGHVAQSTASACRIFGPPQSQLGTSCPSLKKRNTTKLRVNGSSLRTAMLPNSIRHPDWLSWAAGSSALGLLTLSCPIYQELSTVAVFCSHLAAALADRENSTAINFCTLPAYRTGPPLWPIPRGAVLGLKKGCARSTAYQLRVVGNKCSASVLPLPRRSPPPHRCLPLALKNRRLRAALRMVAAETEAAPTTTGPSPVGGPLRVGMFGGGTVGGGVYEICEEVREGKWPSPS